MTDRTTYPAEESSPERESRLETELARGRRGEMPFVLVGGTALVAIAVVAALTGALLLVWWLS